MLILYVIFLYYQRCLNSYLYLLRIALRLGVGSMVEFLFTMLFFIVLWILSDILERYYTDKFPFKKRDKDEV